MGTAIFEGDARDVATIMPVMDSAFDAEFGEAWTAAQCLSLLSIPSSSLILAKSGTQVAGFALTRWVLDEEELLMIGVRPEFQRRGIATDLIAYLIRRAKSLRRERVFLEVRANNSAKDFYRSMGFEPFGTRKDYYKSSSGTRIDATTMSLKL